MADKKTSLYDTGYTDVVDGERVTAWLPSLAPIQFDLFVCSAVDDEKNTMLILFNDPSYGTRKWRRKI